MPAHEGKLNPGIEYQFKTITYAAACLSEDENIEYYQLYTNQDEVPGYDDCIIKIKYKMDPNYHVRLLQIKHTRSKYNFDFMKHKLNDYREFAEEIIRKKDAYTFLRDVPSENIEFWFFTNSNFVYSVEEPIMMRKKVPYLPLECDLQREKNHKTIFPFVKSESSFRLVPRDINEHSDFFDKFHLLLYQPDINRIFSRLSSLNPGIFTRDTTSRIYTFVYDHLKKPPRKNNPLNITKDVFEIEVMRLCLSQFVISPKHCVEVQDELARNWIDTILNFDVTIVNNDYFDVKSYLFGCVWRLIKKLYGRPMDWNTCIDNLNRLSSDFDIFDFCREHLQPNNVRHWAYLPDTIDSLLVELWKCNYMPMILGTDCNLRLLEKYRHLNRKFIILDKNNEILNKIGNLGFNYFASVADINKDEERNEFLSKIYISLQGRFPTDLAKIVGSEKSLMEQLQCSQILHLIKERKLFLNKSCLDCNDSIVFLMIDSEHSAEEIDVDTIDVSKDSNIIINCGFSDAENYAMTISANPTFNTYSICYLQDLGDKFEFIEGDISKLMQFLLYDEDDEMYFDAMKKVVPVLGKTFQMDNHNYVSRSLRRATIDDESCLDSLDKRIYLVTGDVDSLKPAVRSKCLTGAFDLINLKIRDNLKENRNVFIIGEDEDWFKFSGDEHSLCHVKVKDGKMELIKYKRCQNLSAYMSYNGDTFNEKDFFTETSKDTVVVTGDPGIGKSTLLTSLFKGGEVDDYSIFCDLVDYRHDLVKPDSDLYKDPLNFIYNKFTNSLTVSDTQIPIYNKFLRCLCVTYEKTGKLILLVDSFDEIIPIYKKEVFDFMKKISKSKIRIVIASRLIADSLLINNFEVQPIKVTNFSCVDVQNYFKHKNLPMKILQEISNEVLGNPLYLTFLDILNKKNALSFKNINLFNLCRSVIEEKIRLYYHKQNCYYNPETTQREDVLEIHKSLATATIFGRKTVARNDYEYKKLVTRCCGDPIKLGIIVRFTDDYPKFLHHTYEEFLAAERLKEMSENGDHATVKSLYEKTLDGSNIQVRRFFDAFVCENLELHEAVLAEDFELVDHLCVKKTECLDVTDKYGRTALHLAASYCSGETFVAAKSSKILENIARYMKQKGCDLNAADSLLGWKWFQYIENNERLLEEAHRLGLTMILNTLDFGYVINIEKPMKESLNY